MRTSAGTNYNSPSHPHATLGALPAELKAQIVRHCFHQDGEVALLLTSLGQQRHDAKALEELRIDHSGTVKNLFEVSREWSALAAPYRFRVLKSSKAHSNIFRFAIARLRASHFREVVLDSCPANAIDLFINVLLQLNQVDTMTIEEKFCSSTFGGLELPRYRSVFETDTAAVARAVRTTLRKMASLNLRCTSTRLCRSIIKASHCLRSLRVDFGSVPPAHERLSWLLERLPPVEELALAADNWRGSASALVVRSDKLPDLRSLSVAGSGAEAVTFALVAHFAANLKVLKIDMDISARGRQYHAFTPSCMFPSLEELHLAGYEHALDQVVEPLSPHRLPRLEILQFEMRDGIFHVGNLARLVWSLADALPRTLKTLRLLAHRAPLHAWELREPELWRASGIDVRFSLLAHTEPFPVMLDVPGWRDHYADGDIDTTDDLSAVADKTVDFLAAWRDRARASGDGVELARLASVLQRAEIERVDMEADGELWDTVEKPVASAQDWLNRSEALAANSDWVRMAKVLRAVELERLAWLTTMTVAARRLVVVGLGNYTHPLTRHSVGQVLLKNLAKRAAASPARLAGTATLLAVKVGRHTSWTTRITLSPPPTCANQTPLEVLFVLPKALMNISGPTVVAALDGFLPPLAAPSRPAPVPSAEEPTQFPARRKKAPPAPLKPMYRLLTLQDDLDLAPSHVKSQRGGGPRGHNGVRSLASALRGSRDFHRLWIGIGRPAERNEVADYVLRPLSRDEVRACEYDEDEGRSGVVLERAWNEVLRVGFEEE